MNYILIIYILQIAFLKKNIIRKDLSILIP